MSDNSIGSSTSNNSIRSSIPKTSEVASHAPHNPYFFIKRLKLIEGSVATLILVPIVALGIVFWYLGKTGVNTCKYLIRKNYYSSKVKKSWEKVALWAPLIIPGVALIGFLLDRHQHITKFKRK